jgi:hypothetical protein
VPPYKPEDSFRQGFADGVRDARLGYDDDTYAQRYNADRVAGYVSGQEYVKVSQSN